MNTSCDCISRVQDKVLKHTQDQGVKATKASIKEQAWLYNDGHWRTLSNIELTREDRKRPETINLIHTFCPFCGLKYPETKSTES